MILNPNMMYSANEIIKYAYSNSKFYHNKYKNLKKLDYTKISYLVPEDIAKNSKEMIASNKIFRTSISSGTTGYPKVFYRTVEDFEKSVQNENQLMKWCEISDKDIVGIVQPFGLCAYGDLTLNSCKKLNSMAIPIGNIDNIFVIKYIKYFGITVLDISPSKLSDLIDLIEETHENIHIKKAMVAGEVIPMHLKERAKKILDCDIYNQYGTEELDSLAGASKPGTSMKILKDSFLYEIKNSQKISDNKIIGELVVTSLYHKGTPIIKYATGDICEYNTQKEEMKILGRNIDFYNIYDSVKLYPFHIEIFFSEKNYNITLWESELINNSEFLDLIIKIKDTQCQNINLEKIAQEFSSINPEINDLVKSNKLNIFFKSVSKMSTGFSRKHRSFK